MVATQGQSDEMVVRLRRPHAKQLEVLASAKRFNVLMCGRRWGKTELIKEVLIKPALEGYPTGYFTPSYKLLIEVWDGVLWALGKTVLRSNATERRIELKTGGVIEMWTLDDPDAGRSRKYKVVVIDEAQKIDNLLSKWRLAIRPTLLDYQGSAWFVGSALSDTDFAALFEMAGQPKRAETWARWQRPTSENPYIPQSELDEARAETPELEYLQEYEAQLIPGGAGVFRYVTRAIDAYNQQYGPMVDSYLDLPKGRQYQLSTDLASTQDWSVTVVWDAERKLPVYIDRRQGDYIPQVDSYVAMVEHLGVTVATVEINSNKAVVELMEAKGVPVNRFITNNDSKKQIIDQLALAFENGEMLIPEHAQLKSELLHFKGERLPGGRVRYQAADGHHDDCVMALAIGWYGINENLSIETLEQNPLFG
jgi:hypothetical protein